jgi:hypothetical protein
LKRGKQPTIDQAQASDDRIVERVFGPVPRRKVLPKVDQAPTKRPLVLPEAEPEQSGAYSATRCPADTDDVEVTANLLID